MYFLLPMLMFMHQCIKLFVQWSGGALLEILVGTVVGGMRFDPHDAATTETAATAAVVHCSEVGIFVIAL